MTPSPKQPKTTEEIADLIVLKYFAGKMGQYSATVEAITVDIKEALDTKRLAREEAEKQLDLHIASNKISIEGYQAKLSEAQKRIEGLEKLAYLEGEPGHETTWKSEAELLLEHNTFLRSILEKVYNKGKGSEVFPKSHVLGEEATTEFIEVEKALSLTPSDIRSQLEETQNMLRIREGHVLTLNTQLEEARKEVENLRAVLFQIAEGHSLQRIVAKEALKQGDGG